MVADETDEFQTLMLQLTTDSATTFLSTVVGGRSNKVPVVFDETNWVIG